MKKPSPEIEGAYRSVRRWLEMPTVDDVFAAFKSAFDSFVEQGTGDRRFLFIPGTRENRCLLVAHADTVWDGKPGFPPETFVDEDGFVRSKHPDLGIGADDRAGCAALWEMRDLGHSMLITDGEEKHLLGAKFLRDECPDLLDHINQNHVFAVQFDRMKGDEFKCYTCASEEFRTYVHEITGFTEPDRKRGSDIKAICRDISGVNLSIGYRDEHTPQESLNLHEWQHVIAVARVWLNRDDLQRFPHTAPPESEDSAT